MERRGGFFQKQIGRWLGCICLLLIQLACGTTKVPELEGAQPGTPSTGLLAPVIITPASYSISKTNSIVISGSCETAALVALSGSSSNVATCVTSSFSFPVTKTSDGTYTFNVSQSNSQGETSGTSSVTWVLDTTAPVAPVISFPVASPFASNGNTLTLLGTCEAGATVKVSGAVTGSTSCLGGAYSLPVSKTTDGSYTLTLTQTDAVGNTSTSASTVWKRDTVAPSAPTLTSPSSNPFTSGDTNLSINGACEVGALVNLAGAATASATCTTGTYSFPVTKNVDGTYNYAITQTDPATNTSTATNFKWIRDTSIPATPTITTPTTNPYISNTNTVTLSGACITGNTVALAGDVSAGEVTSPSNSLTLTCAGNAYSFTLGKSLDNTYNFTVKQTDPGTGLSSANASLQWVLDTVAPSAPVITTPASSPLKSNAGSITIAGSCETGATVNLTGDATNSMTCASSAFSFSVSKSSDATYNFSVGQTDSAGNTSSTASQQWQRSTVAPAAPTITTPATSAYLTNTNSITIAGACVTGNTVNLSGSGTASFVCASAAYTFTVNQSSDGTYLYDVSQTDLYGNTSPIASESWTRDTLAPAAPAITSPTANPYTSGDSSFNLTGTCESGATVNLSGAQTSSTTCSSGSYSFTLSQTANGSYVYSLSQTDLASNVSGATSFQWDRDNTIPSTPVITAPNTTPFYTKVKTLTITGTCVTGNNINLGGNILSSEVTSPAGLLTQTCSSNSFSFSVQKSGDGSYTLLVNQENTTTGIISADASLIWIVDTVVPLAPVISNPATSPYTASGNLTLSGTCETGTTVKVAGDATLSTTCTASAFSFTVTKAVDATYNFSLTQTDLAGNVSAAATQTWVRDSNVTPSPVITTPTGTNYSSNSTSLTISGTCITGNTITLGGNVTSGDVTSPAGSLTQTCANNSFSYVVSKSSDGTYSFSLKQTSVGQGDSALVPLNWTRDTVAPNTTLATNPTDPNLSVDAIFTFTSPDTTAVFECQLDSASYTACTSPVTYSAVSQGSHTFNVRAKDPVGNVDASPATYSWTQMSYKTIALYHFTSGNSLSDSSQFPSPYTNNLSDTTSTVSVTGKFTDGQSFSSASSQFLSRADNASLRALNSIMSFEAQVKFSALPANNTYQVLASKSGAAGNAGWEVRVKKQGGSNYYLIFIGSSDGTAVTEVKSTTVTLDTTSFHHVAVTWNKGAVKFYFDGTTKGSGTVGVSGSTTLFASSAALRIGRSETMSSSITYFSGVIDELRLSQVLRWTSTFTAPASEYPTAD